MTNPFKAGDRVRRIGPDNGSRMKNGSEYIVASTIGNDIVVEGDFSCWFASKFELVAEKTKTDEELAAEYREFRDKAKKIATELRNRGYEPQSKGVGGFWGPMLSSTHQYRFVKNITKEI